MSGSEPKPSMPPASAFCCGVQCLFCMKEQPPERPFMVCGRCKGPMYCSKACQRAHWPQHKQHCGTMAKRIAHVEDTYGNQLVERLNRWDYDNGGGMIALARTLVGEDRIRTHALNVETAYRPVLKPHFVVVKVDVFELAMMREAQPNLYNLIQEYNAPQVERIRPNCRMAFVLLTCHNEKSLAKVVPLLYDNTVLCKPMSIEEIIHRMNNRTFNTEEIVDVPASIQAAEAVTNKLCKRLAGL